MKKANGYTMIELMVAVFFFGTMAIVIAAIPTICYVAYHFIAKVW